MTHQENHDFNKKISSLDKIFIRDSEFENGAIQKSYNSIFFGDYFFTSQLVSFFKIIENHGIASINVIAVQAIDDILKKDTIFFELHFCKKDSLQEEIKNIKELSLSVDHVLLFDDQATILFYLNKDMEILLFSTKKKEIISLVFDHEFIFFDVNGKISSIVKGKDEAWVANNKCLASTKTSLPYWLENLPELFIQRGRLDHHSYFIDMWKKICVNYQWKDWE